MPVFSFIARDSSFREELKAEGGWMVYLNKYISRLNKYQPKYCKTEIKLKIMMFNKKIILVDNVCK